VPYKYFCKSTHHGQKQINRPNVSAKQKLELVEKVESEEFVVKCFVSIFDNIGPPPPISPLNRGYTIFSLFLEQILRVVLNLSKNQPLENKGPGVFTPALMTNLTKAGKVCRRGREM
jgi:hypothetical protein